MKKVNIYITEKSVIHYYQFLFVKTQNPKQKQTELALPSKN
jgi:hypothetical protein